MSYLYSRYLKNEKKTGASCRLPSWNMGSCGDGEILSEEEIVSEEEQMPEETESRMEKTLEGFPGTFSGTEDSMEESAEEKFCEENMPGKVPVPGWEPGDLPESDFGKEEEQDMAYFRTLYPSCIRRMRDYVEEECDHLDGPGSLIYDEYPDRVRLGLARDRIFTRMKEDSVPEAVYQEEFARDVAETLLYQEILSRRASGKGRS